MTKYVNQVPCVAAVILRQDWRVLLVRRAIEPFIRMWCLPSGHVDLGELPDDAVVREVREETNLQIDTSTIVPQFFLVHSDPRHEEILLIVYETMDFRGALLAGTDASAVEWWRWDLLPELSAPEHGEIIRAAVDSWKQVTETLKGDGQ